MTLKSDLETYIDKWYKYNNSYIKPVKIQIDGIKCWEYNINGSYYSLFDRRIIEWSDLDKILNIEKSDEEIIDLAIRRLAKRMLIR